MLSRKEAEKDYQLAAGITQDVDADDSIWKLTKARLPLASHWDVWWSWGCKYY